MLMIKSTQVDFFVAIAKKGCDVVFLVVPRILLALIVKSFSKV